MRMMFSRSRRGLQRSTTAGARARPALHPARRPRAERLHLDRARLRLVGYQPVRGHRGGRLSPVGPCPWRRQRGGAEHAGGSRRNGGVPKVSAKQVTRTIQRQADGLRPRVYKNYDPRAKLMRKTCPGADRAGPGNDPLFKLAMAAGRSRWSDDYFIARKLYPNVDFYSGIVQRAIGIPTVHRDLRAGPHGGLDRPAQQDSTTRTRSAVRANSTSARCGVTSKPLAQLADRRLIATPAPRGLASCRGPLTA